MDYYKKIERSVTISADKRSTVDLQVDIWSQDLNVTKFILKLDTTDSTAIDLTDATVRVAMVYSQDGKDGSTLSVFSSSPNLAEYTPIAYPKNSPPSGYLMMMGQSISSSTYPILFSLYGGTLPDLRGEFIRGWDNGRGKDTGRNVLSTQGFALQNMTGSLGSVRTGSTTPPLTGVFYLDGGSGGSITGAGGTGFPSIGFNASRVAQTASETRPTNVAFNYIVKAG